MVVNKVLFSYYLTPLFGGEDIFFVHSKRGYNVGEEELSKVDRKCHVFEKNGAKNILLRLSLVLLSSSVLLVGIGHAHVLQVGIVRGGQLFLTSSHYHVVLVTHVSSAKLLR